MSNQARPPPHMIILLLWHTVPINFFDDTPTRGVSSEIDRKNKHHRCDNGGVTYFYRNIYILQSSIFICGSIPQGVYYEFRIC